MSYIFKHTFAVQETQKNLNDQPNHMYYYPMLSVGGYMVQMDGSQH